MIYYNLAYGSNMSLNRLLARLPNAKRIGVATVTGFQLTFNKKGFETSDAEDILYGVLYQLDASEKDILDEIEGERYDNKHITVTTMCGKKYDAYCYVANTLDDALLPYDWYLKHVLTGALEAQLPPKYIQQIESQLTQIDADIKRAELEFSIYK